ncbi:hypothetical protein [Roseibium sp. M-1]
MKSFPVSVRKFDLDYSGPDRDFRVRAYLRAKIACCLETPALFPGKDIGPAGYERLKMIYRSLLLEIDETENLFEAYDKLTTIANDQILSAVGIVREQAIVPNSSQTDEQTKHFEDLVQRFAYWFGNGRICSCEVCKNDHDPFDLPPASFRQDDTDPVSACLRRLVREVELARFFVEQLYGELLPSGGVRIDIAFAKPASDQLHVNGSTQYRDPKAMRRKIREPLPIRTASVVLSLPNKLNAETLHSILYVAAHELGIHSVQQLGLKSAPNADDTDPIFSEGMVEAAIHDALQEIIREEEGHMKFLKAKAYQEASLKRHFLHTSPTARGMTDPVKIYIGAECYGRLKTFINAAMAARLLKAEEYIKGVRPILQLSRARNGDRWARRLMLAFNLLPFNSRQQEQLYYWLEKQMSLFSPLEKWLAELSDCKSKGGLPPEDELVRFLHLLQQIWRNPHNPRFQTRLLHEIEG